MPRISVLCALLCGLFPPAAQADGIAGRFDYYVLALSWSPNWCALEGAEEGSPQCELGANFGWILHGLWPQYETGWPAECDASHPPPSRQTTLAMADIMGSEGLARYQWRRHGTCSGLAADAYFAEARAAFEAVAFPEAFDRLDHPVTLPALLVEEAFLAADPRLTADQLTVTCRSGYVQEVRICLTRELAPRPCGDDVIRDCDLEEARFLPIP